MSPPAPKYGHDTDVVNVTTRDGRTGQGWYNHSDKKWIANLKAPFEVVDWSFLNSN